MTTNRTHCPRLLRTTGLALVVAGVATTGLSALPSAVGAAAPAQLVAPASAATISILGLREGATGDGVRVVQERLLGLGYVIVTGADGVFGPRTTRVLERFQEQNGLNPTGVITENTAKFLGYPGGIVPLSTGGSAPGVTSGSPAPSGSSSSSSSSSSSTPSTSSSTGSYVGMSRGATGDAVRVLQERLMAPPLSLNLGPAGADGVFGAATERGVQRVQEFNGLPETGVVTERVAQILGLTSTTTPQAEPAATLLQYGSQGEAVKRVQQLLIDAGITVTGGADGVFGLATQRAVREFQQARGLPVTGKVDSATEAALTGSAPSAGSSSSGGSSSSAVVGLRLGSTGAGVAKVQQAIIATGMFLRGGADGIFGQATHNALVKYQRTNGLSPTGVVDEATARLMGLGPSAASGIASAGSGGGGSTAAGYAVYDERSDRVSALQRALISAGIAVGGGVDGVFGAQTLGAVRAFQQARGLPATGKVDQATGDALGLAAMNAPAAAPAIAVMLQARPVGGACWYGDTWQAARGGGRAHLGVDIGGAEGTPLRAAVTGRITYRYEDRPGSLSGNALKITMDDGTYIFYAHLSSFEAGIEVGTTVQAGQVIGYMGHTGNAGVPHLHLEIHPGGGSAVNPYPIVKATGAC